MITLTITTPAEGCWTVVVAEVLRVLDGDTFDVHVSVWMAPLRGKPLLIPERIRLLDFDTDEMTGGTPESRERARRAKAFTVAWLAQDGPVLLLACRGRDSFGRALARVYRGSSVLSDELRAAGHEKAQLDRRLR